jgi:hypothetical protein
VTDFSELRGKTLTAVGVNRGQGDDYISFTTDHGCRYIQRHHQDRCESVDIDDICGDVADLIGTPILLAEEVSHSGGEGDSSDWPEGVLQEYVPEIYTWTFYKLTTIKGSVTIRWYGTSNGYYSESVHFSEEA